MSVETHLPVFLDGRRFHGGKMGFVEGGAFVLDLFTTPPPEPRGTYFTTIPISPLEYRKQHPTRAGMAVELGRLTVIDDWGARHEIRADSTALGALAIECVKNGLAPVVAEQPGA